MEIDNYKKYLSNIESIKKSKGKLIYGIKRIPVSKISNQYFCEKQVELTLLHGERNSYAKQNGQEGHSADHLVLMKTNEEKMWSEAY